MTLRTSRPLGAGFAYLTIAFLCGPSLALAADRSGIEWRTDTRRAFEEAQALGKRVAPLAESIGAKLVLPCDVEELETVDAAKHAAAV